MIENINLVLAILVILLVFCSAFFSLVETAFTNCSKAKINHLIKEGNKKAINVEILLKKSESTISTILLCNNAINIMASAIATSVLIKFFGEAGVIHATLIMTVLVLVFGEITPKTYALKNSEAIILSSSFFILLLVTIFSPFTRFIQNIITKIFELFNSNNTKKNDHDVSDLEEIKGTIDLKHKEGSIVKYDKDMLDSILDLDETEITNAMTHRQNIFSINIKQSLEAILKIAFKINHSKIPMWKGDEDNIVSILDVKSLVMELHHNKGDISKISLEQFTTLPWFVPASNTLKSQLISFRNKKQKFAIVIDEYGALLGIITLEDILEEIVGDLEERERSQDSLQITKFKNGSYKILGEMSVRDINRQLNWNLSDGDENTTTLAGLLLFKIERIPQEKEEFEFDGFKFVVLKVKDNKIIYLQVTKTL